MSSDRVVDHAFHKLRADAIRGALLLALSLTVVVKALGLASALLAEAEPVRYYVPPAASHWETLP